MEFKDCGVYAKDIVFYGWDRVFDHSDKSITNSCYTNGNLSGFSTARIPNRAKDGTRIKYQVEYVDGYITRDRMWDNNGKLIDLLRIYGSNGEMAFDLSRLGGILD